VGKIEETARRFISAVGLEFKYNHRQIAMEEKKDIEAILQKHNVDPSIMTEEELKFIQGGYSVSETEGEGADSVRGSGDRW
jgi:hypothetical protein